MKRALIVIDVQNEYITGSLPISFPPLGVSLLNIIVAMHTAETAKIPVVVVQQMAGVGSAIFAEGSDGWQLRHCVNNRPRDLLLPKRLPSSFAGTQLDTWLKARAIDVVTLVGYMSQNCVESTTRDAMQHGYAVEVLSDATGTLALRNQAGTVTAQELHEAVMVTLHSRFAAVVTTDDWRRAVENNAPLIGSTLFASTADARNERDGLGGDPPWTPR